MALHPYFSNYDDSYRKKPRSEGKKTSNNFQYAIYNVRIIVYGRKQVLSGLNLFKVETREIGYYQNFNTDLYCIRKKISVYATKLKTNNTIPADHIASFLFSVFLVMHKEEVPGSKMRAFEYKSTIETTD